MAEALGYTDVSHTILDHVDEDDRINSKTQGQNNPEFGQRGTWLINESGLYSLVLSSKLPSAKAFKRWITHDVIPSIRKTGSYNLPQDYPSALRALADAEEQRLALISENAEQQKVIVEQKPKVEYYDTVLQSPDLITTNSIAKDYGKSAVWLNHYLLKRVY